MLLERRAVARLEGLFGRAQSELLRLAKWARSGHTHFHFLWVDRRPLVLRTAKTIAPRSSMHRRLSLLPWSAKEILWLINTLRVS